MYQSQKILTLFKFIMGCVLIAFAIVPVYAGDYIVDGEAKELGPDQTFDEVVVMNGATLTTYGELHCKNLKVDKNSKIVVKTYSDSLSGSGVLKIFAEGNILITNNSLISADGAGNDERGTPTIFDSGASYGGKGNRSDRPTYGSESGASVLMGSRAKNGGMGGGAIYLTCSYLYIDATSKITSNGSILRNDRAGSGGGILINCTSMNCAGDITADGGDAYYDGGGGRIKIHYRSKKIEGKISVSGWDNGQPGTIWYNIGVEQPTIISPADGEQVGSKPQFQFSAVDNSDKVDNHPSVDRVRYKIELSRDNFATIAYTFDIQENPFGWADEQGQLVFDYEAGQVAIYTVQTPLDSGEYQWRVFANDDKESEPSEVRTLTIIGALTVTDIEPNGGALSGGTPVTITGTNFIDGATVTIGGNPATNVTVASDTKITANAPEGSFGIHDVVVTNPDGTSGFLKDGYAYVIVNEKRQVEIQLAQGANLFSLPLNPETAMTAADLAKELGATLVIRAVDGIFKVYISEDSIDFPLEMGKGYIVNLLEPKSFKLTGYPWGTMVPAAPSVANEPIDSTWAFVVAGSIQERQPLAYAVRIANERTGQTIQASVDSTGRFVVPFVDFSKQSVANVGDEITLQLLGKYGEKFSSIQRWQISHEQIARGYMLVSLPIVPSQTRLLQNFPNPFNPETWIPFHLASNAVVSITIYEPNGRPVRHLNLGTRPAGWYVSRTNAAYWDGRNAVGELVSSGVYFYRFQAGAFVSTGKMLLMK